MVPWGTGTVLLAVWMTVNEARVGNKQRELRHNVAQTVTASAGKLKGSFWEARRQLEVRKGDVITALHTRGPVGSFGLEF